MDDKHYKKLMRRFTFMWFLSLLLFLWIIFSTQQSDQDNLRQYVDDQVKNTKSEIVDDLPASIPGKDGRDGVDGKDGITTTVERHTTEIITKPGKQGPKGDKGDTGAQGEPGKSVEIQINPETGDREIRVKGDSFWQVLVPCVELLAGCKQ